MSWINPVGLTGSPTSYAFLASDRSYYPITGGMSNDRNNWCLQTLHVSKVLQHVLHSTLAPNGVLRIGLT